MSALNKLDHCVQTLKLITRNIYNKKTPSQIADLYLAAVGILCHLQRDRTFLDELLDENPDAICPPPNDIPAITAVLQDPVLFDALISCLKVTSGGVGCEHERSELGGNGRQSHHPHLGTNNSRKRTNSINNEETHASKAIKLSHSPTPAAARLFLGRQHAADIIANINIELNPTVNVRILAATILYTSFAHLDHWPVPLVKAYAEDCFGSRRWVDDENCRLLVENLRLAHKSNPSSLLGQTNDDGDATIIDATALEDAARVSDSYSRIHELIALTEEGQNHLHQLLPGQQQEQGPRGSLKSVGSTGASMTLKSYLKPSSSRDEENSIGGVTVENGSREVKDRKRKAPKSKKESSNPDGGASSSSGEEDEEVIATNKSGGDDAAFSSSPRKKSDPERQGSPTDSYFSSEHGSSSSPLKRRLYPLAQQRLNLPKVRQRFFGVNQENAHVAISCSLAERLDAKAKQNSALLQSLHSFSSVAGIRSLIAGNLEKWLQSPGLSGLARTLFASTVTSIENIDPPKPEDLEAIRKILSMHLKANQLSAHIENITAIASTVPTLTVARHVYHQLLSEVLITIGSGADASASDRLKMVGAVYSALPKDISAEGMSASLLMLVGESGGAAVKKKIQGDRKKLVKQLKRLLQLVAEQLGTSFDACRLIECLLRYKAKDAAWTLEDEEERARLVFQCVLLLVPASASECTRHPSKLTRKSFVLTDAEVDGLKKNLSIARKLILTWFCNDYGPNFKATSPVSSDILGAGLPNYRSVLGGVEEPILYPDWLKIARCLLFMESGDSDLTQQFVCCSEVVDEKDAAWYNEKHRIDHCYEYGCDFDDEMMWIVLKSASVEDGGIDPEIALTLLEHLFECCNTHRRGLLKLSDIMLAWELYSLVCYEPPESILMTRDSSAGSSEASCPKFDDAEAELTVDGKTMGTVVVKIEDLELPQLAYPGMWWRVTILALIMCGVAPKQIGAPVWEEHPTLRAMIKMVVSARYRFPTVDCDEADRAEMKKSEQLMREEEAKIAETLFLPVKPAPSRDPESGRMNHGRNRISARQQQKRERAQRKRREKEATEALAVDNKRKKLLRAAQRTIILWDPTGFARKPPREAAELLVAVDLHFSLSKTFQSHVEPDFLLMTIGKTTRGAIERAYDWLIPIISNIPDTIARLHASASCVLLLRAYGTEGDERVQLKQLSAPLLRHVSDSVTGKFGRADAVRAFDLLLSDVASHHSDRRRCARRVLFDSIGKLSATENEGRNAGSSWMQNVLQLNHAKWLVGHAIKHMSTAIGFERGLVLRNLLMALDNLICFAMKTEVAGDLDFASVFIGMVSSRPSVCAEALDRFADLRTLGVKTVYQEFEQCIMDSSRVDPANSVSITLYPPSQEKETILSISLLQAASVLLSIWTEVSGAAQEQSSRDNAVASTEAVAALFVANLANMLLHPVEAMKIDDGTKSAEKGLASATLVQSGKGAVCVESWVMLAKARTRTFARRAALTAPTVFLPRLLLCAGLPRASLLTMINRLGKLGDASTSHDAVFARLLIPSAASEWDIGRLGHRWEVARKLLGRLSAYVRMNRVSFKEKDITISISFLGWLSRECLSNTKPRKPKPKAKFRNVTKGLSTLAEVSLVRNTLKAADCLQTEEFLANSAEESWEMFSFRHCVQNQTGFGCEQVAEMEVLLKNVKRAIDENQPDHLEILLYQPSKTATNGSANESSQLTRLAELIMQAFLKLEHQQDSLTRIIVTSVPHLTRVKGSPELWKMIFSCQGGEVDQVLNSLLCRCLAFWCASHVSSCYEWLLSTGKGVSSSSLYAPRVTRFLVLTSGQQSVHVEGFSSKVTLKCVNNWGKSEVFVGAAVAFAFEGMKGATSSGFRPSLVSRNDLPDWLILLLALAKCGRVQMNYICESVLKRISQPTNDLSLPLLRAVFLLLYVSNPQAMNLGTAMIRSLLMEAAQEYSASWLNWRSPLDDQLKDMLETVMTGSGQRLVRPLSDMSKKHPLLILRKSFVMMEFLGRDALEESRGTENWRSLARCQSFPGLLNTSISGKLIKVHVRHWGFSYTEFVWIALLDILCSIPGPVLFSCGLNLGFLSFLNVNMSLMYVQSQLQKTERDSRLRDKLKDTLAAFRKSSWPGWERWMASTNHGLPTLGEMRNVMICCDFFDPEDIVKLE